MRFLPTTRGAVRDSMQLFRRLVEELGRDDYAGLAAQMTYYFMLGLFPTLILIIGLIGLLPIDQDVQRVAENLLSGMPPEVASLLREFLTDFNGHHPGSGLLLWLAAALWAASRGFAGARKGLDRVFRVRMRRNPLLKRAKDLLVAASCVLVLGLAYALLLGGRRLLQFLLKASGRQDDLGAMFSWLSWPFSMALGTLMVMVLYRVLPDRKLGWRALFAGALPVVVAWSAMTGGLRLWIGLLGDFDQVYGSLARFFLLMMIIWLYALTLLLGAEIAYRVAERGEDGEDGGSGEAADAPA